MYRVEEICETFSLSVTDGGLQLVAAERIAEAIESLAVAVQRRTDLEEEKLRRGLTGLEDIKRELGLE